MPTISQLPGAVALTAQDELPISQSGTVRAATVAELLANTQSAITLPSGDLLGRASAGDGPPEALTVGLGLVLANGTISADGADHAAFTSVATFAAGDSVVLNSPSGPAQLPLAALRQLFAAGANVTIDANGTIAAQGGPSGPAGVAGASIHVGNGAPAATVGASGDSYVDALTGNLFVRSSPGGWLQVGNLAGPAGAPGAGGPAGPAGQPGPAGPTGLPGPAGAVGAMGPRGPAGANGAAGAPGASLFTGSGAPGSAIGQDGDTYLDTVAGNLYVHAGGAWSQTANITGPAGAPGAPGAPLSITGLSPVVAIGASDLVGISQGGTDHAIAYADFLDGQTIDQAQAAGGVSDTDTLLVGQGGSTMLRQSFSAVWDWIGGKLPGYRPPVVELTGNTTLDMVAHNGRVLVCSQPLTLTASTPTMGSGFICDLINVCTGPVALAGFVASSGPASVAPGQFARIFAATYSGGTVAYAAIGGATAATLTVPGQVPGLVVGAVTSGSVTLSWGIPAGGAPTSYQLQSRLLGTTAWSVQAVTGTSCTLGSLLASSAYQFEVLAVNAAGAGPASAIAQATTLANTPALPAQVAGLTAGAVTAGSVALSWLAATGAATYTVLYRVSGTAAWSQASSGVAATSTTVNGLVAGTAYDFQVIGVNAAGNGTASSVLTATTAAAVTTPPAQVIGVSAGSSSASSLLVTWAAAEGAASYTVQTRPTGATAWMVAASGLSATQYTVGGLAAGTQYDIQVIAANAGGSGPASAIANGTTAAASSPPGPVTGLAAGTATASSIALSWTAPATATSYTVQYRATGSTAWSSFASPIAATSVTVTGLSASKSYDFQVAASNSAGIGGYAAPITASTTVAAPGAVTGLAAGTATASAIPLTWTAPPGATSITVQYTTHGGTTWTTATSSLAGTAAGFTVTGLSPSTSYDLQVFATNAGGNGATATLSGISTLSAGNYALVTGFQPVGGGTTYAHASSVQGNVNDGSASADGSHTAPSAVYFGWTQSATQGPASTTGLTQATSGLTTGGHNYWYAYGVPTPPTAGTWYFWAVATGTGGTIVASVVQATGGSGVTPQAFTIT